MGLPNQANHGVPSPTGTGFFVSHDGWFVTAAHVVTTNGTPDGPIRSDIDKAWLMKENRQVGPSAMCQFVSLDSVLPEIDLALLKVDFAQNSNKDWLKTRSEFPFLQISVRELEEGDSVYSFGYPLSETTAHFNGGMVFGSTSLCPRVTSAIVSSTMERTKMFTTGGDPKTYVLDKALNYGNSGGPILSVETGHVHALCSRFQPLHVPQLHLQDANGNYPLVMIPSLYGIVSRLDNEAAVQLFNSRGIPIVDL
ncbi:S1 family peptidase [Chromobacterium violaceum]|uniref:S1 family peptidase n=1 Tax=Chromobacterium violaceum TaxID=536 RepID=UPI003DA8AABD